MLKVDANILINNNENNIPETVFFIALLSPNHIAAYSINITCGEPFYNLLATNKEITGMRIRKKAMIKTVSLLASVMRRISFIPVKSVL